MRPALIYPASPWLRMTGSPSGTSPASFALRLVEADGGIWVSDPIEIPPGAGFETMLDAMAWTSSNDAARGDELGRLEFTVVSGALMARLSGGVGLLESGLPLQAENEFYGTRLHFGRIFETPIQADLLLVHKSDDPNSLPVELSLSDRFGAMWSTEISSDQVIEEIQLKLGPQGFGFYRDDLFVDWLQSPGGDPSGPLSIQLSSPHPLYARFTPSTGFHEPSIEDKSQETASLGVAYTGTDRLDLFITHSSPASERFLVQFMERDGDLYTSAFGIPSTGWARLRLDADGLRDLDEGPLDLYPIFTGSGLLLDAPGLVMVRGERALVLGLSVLDGMGHVESGQSIYLQLAQFEAPVQIADPQVTLRSLFPEMALTMVRWEQSRDTVFWQGQTDTAGQFDLPLAPIDLDTRLALFVGTHVSTFGLSADDGFDPWVRRTSAGPDTALERFQSSIDVVGTTLQEFPEPSDVLWRMNGMEVAQTSSATIPIDGAGYLEYHTYRADDRREHRDGALAYVGDAGRAFDRQLMSWPEELGLLQLIDLVNQLEPGGR